jgi:imidazolonepropionase-like amidohydrolase
MKRATLVVAALAGVMVPSCALAQSPKTIFIKNATLMTVTHGNVEHGSILIRDGKIADVGDRGDQAAVGQAGERFAV